MALEVFPEDWERGLAVVAHPDDMEYGAAAAVARWTKQGKLFAYVLVSDGEAGIASMDPAEAGPVRRREQEASCAVVGVDEVTFLGWADGAIVIDPDRVDADAFRLPGEFEQPRHRRVDRQSDPERHDRAPPDSASSFTPATTRSMFARCSSSRRATMRSSLSGIASMA